MIIKEIIDILEKHAPLTWQEDYDNSGIQVGNVQNKLTQTLVSLDITEAVLDEAISQNCNLIIAHHPLIFGKVKSISGKSEVERCIIKAIKNDICIYAIHTNLDNTLKKGVNTKIAELLGLQHIRALLPKENLLFKLVFYVPVEAKETVLEALYKTGAGSIGNYDECSFSQEGTGTFRPLQNSNPAIGTLGTQEKVKEYRTEIIVPSHLLNIAIKELKEAHPYEEVAYDVVALKNMVDGLGSGAIGALEKPLEANDFLVFLKEKFRAEQVKYTNYNKPIQTVAICGGSGSFLIKNALAQKADAYITADIKYHEFFELNERMMLVNIDHYDMEKIVPELIIEIIKEKNTNFAAILSKINTNPAKYF